MHKINFDQNYQKCAKRDDTFHQTLKKSVKPVFISWNPNSTKTVRSLLKNDSTEVTMTFQQFKFRTNSSFQQSICFCVSDHVLA